MGSHWAHAMSRRTDNLTGARDDMVCRLGAGTPAFHHCGQGAFSQVLLRIQALAFGVAPVFRICSAQGIGESMPESYSTNRALIDLRDKRTDLSVRISLLKDSENPNMGELISLERQLEHLDQRISRHRGP